MGSSATHHVSGPLRPASNQPRRLPDSVLPVVHHAVTRVATRTVVPTTPAPSHVSAPPVTHGDVRFGDATWYAWHPGQCAVHYLPKGTRIWVKDLATGKVISCVVTDFEQDGSRAVDLDTQQFAELAPLAQGVIRVEVTW